MSKFTEEKHDHELKILRGYYESVLDGVKPFEIRSIQDRTFKVGDIVLLKEYIGSKTVPACSYNGELTCKGYEAIKDLPEYDEEKARDACGTYRSRCCPYTVHRYTGRKCWVRIIKVFPLEDIGLPYHVAVTFDIERPEENRPYRESGEATDD